MFDVIGALLRLALQGSILLARLVIQLIPAPKRATEEVVPTWQVSQEFIHLLMGGSYKFDGRILYMQLLDAEGNELPESKSYQAGGKPVMGELKGTSLDINPSTLSWAVHETLTVHSIKLRDPEEQLDLMGIDFTEPQTVTPGNDFVIYGSANGLLSI